MGFKYSAMLATKYIRSRKRKHSYFENQKVSTFNWNHEKFNKRQLTFEILRKIKKRQQRNIIKSLAIISISFLVATLLIWKFLF
jgi:epoxyqueuosine reductase QueG